MRKLMISLWHGDAPLARALLFPPPFRPLRSLQGGPRGKRVFLRGGYLSCCAAFYPGDKRRQPIPRGYGQDNRRRAPLRGAEKRGFRPGIVMLGYKKKRKGAFAVDCKTDTAESAGDEALMLARRTMLPVLVGKRRDEG